MLQIMTTFSDDNVTRTDKFLYRAAINGEFEVFRVYEKQPLDCLLDLHSNTILHIHLNSSTQRSKKFVLDGLSQCPDMLWHSNNVGDIPLHIAASHGHLEIVELLIEQSKKTVHRDLESGSEAGATQKMLRTTNKQGETALHLAIKGGHFVDVVRELLKHEDPKYVYTSNKFGETPLYLATDKKHDDLAVEILNKFESPECSGPKGATVFHAAVCHSFYHETYQSTHDSLLDLMLSKLGSCVSQADENGWTPLHYAAYIGYHKLVPKILEKDKSSAYATDKERHRTPLHMASCRGFGRIMENIIEECPDCCAITDAKGWNLLHYAVFSNFDGVVKEILKNPSLVYLFHCKDIKGYTPLHLIEASPKNYDSLTAWINSDESALDSRVQEDQLWFTSKSLQSPFKRSFFTDFSDRSKEKEAIEWMKDLGSDPFGDTIEEWKGWHQKRNETGEKVIPKLEQAKDSHLVAAALVATVTFAAAFTLPGGYISDNSDLKLNGTPILSRDAAFKAFVVTDAIAMVLSTCSVFIHFITVMLGYKQRYYWLIRTAFWFIVLAMGAMVVAFVTGTYAVLAPNSKGLAIVICVIGLAFFLYVLYAFVRLIYDFIKRDKLENRTSKVSESLRRLLRSAPQYLCVLDPYGACCGCVYID